MNRFLFLNCTYKSRLNGPQQHMLIETGTESFDSFEQTSVSFTKGCNLAGSFEICLALSTRLTQETSKLVRINIHFHFHDLFVHAVA